MVRLIVCAVVSMLPVMAKGGRLLKTLWMHRSADPPVTVKLPVKLPPPC